MKELWKPLNGLMCIIGWYAAFVFAVDYIRERNADKPEIELRKTVNVPDSLFTDDSIYVVSKRLDTVMINDDSAYWQEKENEQREVEESR